MRRLLMEWALTSSLLILAVIALRALLGKRISAALRYALWVVVLIRLLVPVQFFSLPVPVVLSDVDREAIITSGAPAAPVSQGEPTGAPAVVEPPPDGVVVTYDTATAPSDISLKVTSLWDVLISLWLAGSVLMAAAFLFSNLAFARRLHRVRVPLGDADCPLPVYRAENLPSPCLFGLIRPAVYVTAEAARDPVMLRHVLAHEQTHFRHADHVWNLLRSAALAVHWWNPLVWWAAILSRRDCELACDEGALKRLGDGERIAYGRTLLSLITVKPRPGDLLRCATTMTGGQKSVFDRVARIARAPKRWLWAAVVVVLAAVLACVFAFGQAAGAGDTDMPDLDANLSFSLNEDGAAVRIEGSVDGTEMQHTMWFAPSWFKSDDGELLHPLGQLWFQAPLCERTPSLDACWTDESRSAVRVTATPTAMLSSYFPSGNLSFTVDVSNGTLLELDGYIPKMAGGQAERVPTEEEAVRVARIAAKLLTEAEAYYQSHAGELPPQSAPEPSPEPAPEPLPLPEAFAAVLRGRAAFILDENAPPVSLDEVPAILDPYDSYMSPLQYAVVDLSGDGTPEVLVYVLGTAGDMAGYLLLWEDGGQLRGELFDHHDWRNRWFDDLKADGTFLCSDALGVGWSSISRLRYTPAEGWTLYSEAVHRASESPYGAIKLEDLESLMFVERDCSEEEFQEAMELQRAKPDVPWYELPLEDYDGGFASENGLLPLDVPMEMRFSNGAGAWATFLTLHPDGSFEGDYSDMNIGDSGPGYQGSELVCRFHGRFGEIQQVTGASWSMTLEELIIDTGHPIGEEWIVDRLRYISSAPYGFSKPDGEDRSIPLEPGAPFMLYTPEASGKPGGELYGMENESSRLYSFWRWWPNRFAISGGRGGTLGCYGLRNMETGYGFFS